MDWKSLLNKPIQAKRKSGEYYRHAAWTVWLSEYEGEPRVQLVDERTGENYPCFPPRAREDKPADSSDPF